MKYVFMVGLILLDAMAMFVVLRETMLSTQMMFFFGCAVFITSVLYICEMRKE